MGKTIGSIAGTLVLVLVLGLIKYQVRQHSESRARMDALALTQHKKLPKEGINPVDKRHLERLLKAGKQGNYDLMLDILQNIPDDASEGFKKGMAEQATWIKQISGFLKEIEDRASDEGLDLDVMNTSRFLCGIDGEQATSARVDIAISFIDEIESRISEFQQQRAREKVSNNEFDFAGQWSGSMKAVKQNFASMRGIARQIKKIISLHQSNKTAWTWTDGDVLYFDADFCERIAEEKRKIISFVQDSVDAQETFSNSQISTFERLESSLQKQLN